VYDVIELDCLESYVVLLTLLLCYDTFVGFLSVTYNVH